MLTDEQRRENARASNRRYYLKRKNDPAYKEKQRLWGRMRTERIQNNPELRKTIYENNMQRYYTKYRGTQQTRNRCLKAVQGWRERKQEIRKALQALLGAKCIRCGIEDYRLLDFDHIDPATKAMNISQKLNLPFEELKIEVAKCQLLCANCHRLKTMEHRQFDPRVRAFKNPKKSPSF